MAEVLLPVIQSMAHCSEHGKLCEDLVIELFSNCLQILQTSSYSKHYKLEILFPVIQSVARRLGQGELYEGQVSDTEPLVMPKGSSEIEIRSRQVSHSYNKLTLVMSLFY